MPNLITKITLIYHTVNISAHVWLTERISATEAATEFKGFRAGVSIYVAKSSRPGPRGGAAAAAAGAAGVRFESKAEQGLE